MGRAVTTPVRVSVLSIDGSFKDAQPPISITKLECIASGGRVESQADERAMIEWLWMINPINSPLTPERDAALHLPNARTSRDEDTTIAKWILSMWKLIEEVRREG